MLIQFLNLSHNLLTECIGVGKLTSLIELNLNFNKLSSLIGLEDLVNLEKVWLASNIITDIFPLKECKKLKCISVFHNQIFNQDQFIDVLSGFNHLEEISFDANPISSDIYLKYYIMLSMKHVETFDDEKVTELDIELAESYFTENGFDIPKPKGV